MEPFRDTTKPKLATTVTDAHDPATQAAHHMAAQSALHNILPAFEHAGIRVVPVKGILTSRLLYPHLEDRPMRDVDLRIRPRDLPKLRRLLTQQGWLLLESSIFYQSVGFRACNVSFDVETHVGAPGMCSLSVDTMMARSTWQQHPLGFFHHHPEIHDHALLLAMNVYKDRVLDTAPWAIQDLLRITDLPTFCVDTMVQRVREARVQTAVGVLASWLAKHHDSAKWGELAERLLPSPRQRYGQQMLHALSHRQGISENRLRVLLRRSSDERLKRWWAVLLMAGHGIRKHGFGKGTALGAGFGTKMG
ncbi:MAG TPA: nucleotidyltransferase family protein [Polyangiaceae bacterium]|jgi:hypothetical protein|nr:nucleotidyltransferase family protein [Polyangiaceae bacterium]HQK16076.1 nucleotidyltransferase family protein [Polyangiaceae bacterium]